MKPQPSQTDVAKIKAVPISMDELCTKSTWPRVEYALLHQAVTLFGKINTEKTVSRSKIPGLKDMTWHADGLYLETIQGDIAVVPSANVAIAMLAKETL